MEYKFTRNHWKSVQLHLESDLKQKRAENLETLKLHADEVKEVESDIYAVGCKLKSTLEENDTFQKVRYILAFVHASHEGRISWLTPLCYNVISHQAISQLNEELKGMRGLMDGNDDAVMKLVNQLNAIKGQFWVIKLCHYEGISSILSLFVRFTNGWLDGGLGNGEGMCPWVYTDISHQSTSGSSIFLTDSPLSLSFCSV